MDVNEQDGSTGTVAKVRRRAAAAKVAPATILSTKWSEERRGIFLETLATTSNVAESERAATMTPGSAYRERRRSADFRAAWDDALCEGYARLETVLLERAFGGVAKRVTKTKNGGEVTEQFSERLGMALLGAHRNRVMAVRAAKSVDVEGAKAWLVRKLAEMNKRSGGEG